MESKKAELIGTEKNGNWQKLMFGENGVRLIKGYISSYKMNKFGYLTYSMVTTVTMMCNYQYMV